MPFWNGETLLKRLPGLIDPFRKEDVDCAAYTLSIGPEVYVSPSEQAAAEQKVVQLADRASFVIPPGQFAFLLTEQTVTMPTSAIGFISMKASIKFRGLINVSGFHVDPGYMGHLVFAVFNAGPVPILLRRGDPCFLIWYADLSGDSKMVKSDRPVKGLSSAHVNGIAGAELHSIESLAKKIKDVEKAHDDKIHSLEREGALYKVVERSRVGNRSVRRLLAATVTGALLILGGVAFAACDGEGSGGLTSDPGRVSYGAVTCPAGAGAGCCLPLIGDPLSIDAGTCVNSQHACGSPLGTFECDEAADCPVGTVCCYQWGSGAFIVHSRCVTSCPAGEVQACRTNAECVASGACKLRTCGSVDLATCAATSDCP